jgi:two-component system, OmpR family, phosphate regulon sensor histidine kinase PhoR
MTPRPFLVRLILPFALAMTFIVVVCGAIIYLEGERAARRQQIEELNRLATLVRQWLPAGGRLDDADRARLVDSARVLNTRLTLIDGSGNVLLDSEVAPERMENHNDRPEVVEARRQSAGSGVRFSDTLGERAVYVARLVDPSRPEGLVLRLSYPQHVWTRIGTSAGAVVGGAVLCALLVMSLLWLLLQRHWINPVRRLAAAAERMAAGQWAQRIEPDGADDVRFFTDKLNTVSSQAVRQLSDLRDQRADLRVLVDTLPDPVLMVGPDRRVRLINPPAGELFGIEAERAVGQTMAVVVPEEEVLDLVDAAIGDRAAGAEGDGDATTGRSVQRSLHLHRGGLPLTYQAVAVRTVGGGVVLVLRDVSALASTLQMKTDFVANASHELRTPIAAIKIAFETLGEVYKEDPAQTERCVRIIDGHMKRLEEMLQDLMDLSRVESAELRPQVREVRAADLFARLRAGLGAMARKKGVELAFADVTGAGGGPVYFYSDERLIDLVTKNLVENSIKYTPAGGTVSVSVAVVPPHGEAPDGAGEAVVSVADTGIGIAAEHLDRVFERFYQVDAARSGSAGRGTGLGLAIVKHAVAALGGTVRIESAVGKGTTVTCRLPQRALEEGAPSAESVSTTVDTVHHEARVQKEATRNRSEETWTEGPAGSGHLRQGTTGEVTPEPRTVPQLPASPPTRYNRPDVFKGD